MTAGTDLVVIPPTGEVVALDAPTDELAAAIALVQTLEADLKDARASLRDELIRRLDHENRRSAQVGSWLLEADAPPKAYDPGELAEFLAGLVAEGKISQAAMDACLKREVSWKPMKRELSKLAGTLDPQDAIRLQALDRPTGRARGLKVREAAA